MFDLFTPIFGH